MTPLWLALLLPLAELATAYRFYRRIAYTRYYPLMAYLISEAGWHFVAAFHYSIATRWAQPCRMGVRAWVVIAVFRFACIELRPAERARLIGETIAISGTCAWLVAIWTRLTPLENFFIFRGYYHIVLAAALWWLVIRVWRHPLPENRDHRGFRIGMTAWLSIVAFDGTFVRGGHGYWFLPFSDATWYWVNVLSYAALLANQAYMAWAMATHLSCLRPEVAFGKDWLRELEGVR